MKRKIRVGLDFDGVIAYNPFRIVRAPVSFIKKRLLGYRKLSFYYPQTDFQKMIWKLLHESSVFPARGMSLLAEMIERDLVEAHLITARYSFLDEDLSVWLKKYNVKHLFKSINSNKKNEQPHLFKERIVHNYNLDIYIEDNLDIVKHLHKSTSAKIYWVYNLLDRNYPHPHKYPYLEKALEDIMKSVG